MTQYPKISIIISVLNTEQTLQRCLDSITEQTYKNWELIIFDGASTDNTLEILKQNNHIITFWKSEPDKGIYNAWNKALKHVTGEWVYFIGADDYLWQKNVLHQMSKQLKEKSRQFKIIYGSINIVTADGEVLQQMGQPWEIAKKDFFHMMTIPHQGTFHNYKLFVDSGNFDESFSIAGDYEFLMRELKTGSAWFVPDIIVAGKGNEGISLQPFQEALRLREDIILQSRHSIIKSPFYKAFRLLKVEIRKYLMLAFGPHITLQVINIYRTLTNKSKLHNPHMKKK